MVWAEVVNKKTGGIAQWQSIRLQIERSLVQLWLPPWFDFSSLKTNIYSLVKLFKPLIK